MNIKSARLLLLIIISTLLVACATNSKTVQPERRFFWPPEPDEPKIEWISSYFSDLLISYSIRYLPLIKLNITQFYKLKFHTTKVSVIEFIQY